jgi:hypothetical protein
LDNVHSSSSSNCQVSVIVNGVKPYQPATATGPGGPTDYSKWNFVLTSKYTTIKQGPNNKITAKYTCKDNPSGVSFYSVNVIGAAAATTTTRTSLSIPPNLNSSSITVAPKQQERPLTTTKGTNSVGVKNNNNNTLTSISSFSSSSHGNSMENLNANKDPPHCDRSGFPSCYSIGLKDGRSSPGGSCPKGHSTNFCRGWDEAANSGDDNSKSVGVNSLGSHNLQNIYGNALLANSPHCDRPGWPSCYNVGYANGQKAPTSDCPHGHSREFCNGYRAAYYNNHRIGINSQLHIPSSSIPTNPLYKR